MRIIAEGEQIFFGKQEVPIEQAGQIINTMCLTATDWRPPSGGSGEGGGDAGKSD